MAALIAPPCVIALSGTSFTNGIYCTPDDPWPLRLQRDLMSSPECKGEIRILNVGKGSQQSTWGVAQAAVYAPMKPDILLKEGYGINNCCPLPTVRSLADCTADFNAECDAYLLHNPNIVIIHQTMSPASADDTLRGALQTYYDQEKADAAARGILTLDHTANWTAAGKNPLPTELTVNGDKLHPLFANAFGLYSYPLILSTLRTAIGSFWA